MNLPNKLTILRVLLVPFFVLFLLVPSIPYNYLLSLIVFVVASVTDALDGHIARSQNMVTTFGKFLDPLADKVLVVSALICFIPLNVTSAVAVLIIIAREFLVTSLRLVAVADGKVIAASIYGKIKTAFTMVAMVLILVMLTINQIASLNIDVELWGNILMWIAAAITVVSGVEYLWKNKSCIDTTK